MDLTLSIWRQHNAHAPGKFVTYQVQDVTPDMSFLEMLDALNEDLLSRGLHRIHLPMFLQGLIRSL